MRLREKKSSLYQYYNMLPRYRKVPVLEKLLGKQNLYYSHCEPNILAMKCKFWRAYSLRNSWRRRRSVQLSKIISANIYFVYCAVKLVLFK